MLKINALINAQQLAACMTKYPKKLRVLDATWFKPNYVKSAFDNYKEGHIPGALFFDINACSSNSDYSRMLPSETQFALYASSLGIDNETHIVVYNDHPDFAQFSAPRVWWTFRAFGHKDVSILGSGLRSWKDAGYKIATGVETATKKSFTAKFDTSSVKSFEEIETNLASKKFQLVDARSSGSFHGTNQGYMKDIKPGHIPGSCNIPYRSILGSYTGPDGKTVDHGVVKSPEELKKIFSDAGIDLNKPLTTTCGSGMTACCLAFAAFLCGKKDTSVYDGSWQEWYKRSRPDQREECSEN